MPARIGNDVVDLGDPAIAAHHERPRFVERVLCPDERAQLSSSELDPKSRLWALFAAKEAAYKVLVKLDPELPAASRWHRSFRVSPDLRTVRHEGGRTLELSVEITAERVHAVAAALDRSGWSDVLRGVSRTPAGVDPSEAARALLLGALGLPRDRAKVIRDPLPGSWDGFGPPRVCLDGRDLEGVDVSLSHDGRFVAFAACTATKR